MCSTLIIAVFSVICGTCALVAFIIQPTKLVKEVPGYAVIAF